MKEINIALFPGDVSCCATVMGNDVRSCGTTVKAMLDENINVLELIDTPPYRSRKFVGIGLFNEVRKALENLTENIGTSYDGDGDYVGCCAVCGQVSYKEHRETCERRIAEELLARIKKVDV